MINPPDPQTPAPLLQRATGVLTREEEQISNLS